MSAELKPFFKDRSASLDAIYRTLAVTDYTWALRFPEPPCAPADSRRRLLDSRDGLFQTEKGEASPWLLSLLGSRAKDKSIEQALDEASAETKMTEAAYERRRAQVRRFSLALASDKAEGAVRSKLYCSRAAAFEDLAAYHRLQQHESALASQAAVTPPSEHSVFVVAWGSRRAAATRIDTRTGPVLLTDAFIVQDTDHPSLFAYSAKSALRELKATVTRRDAGLGLAILAYSDDRSSPALPLSDAPPPKNDLVFAIGHSEVSGQWTRTSGLVTKSSSETFQTDAAVSSDFSGGPVLNEAGKVVGILVLKSADTEEGRWPVAISASAIARWLDGGIAPVTPALEAIEDAGTAAVLSRTRPNALTQTGLPAWEISGLPPPPSEPRGVCMNCSGSASPSRSYSSYSGGSSSNSGDAQLGEALGKFGAVLILEGIPALFRGIGKLFKKNNVPQRKFVDNRERPPSTAPQPPKPPPDPLRPVSLKLTVTRSILAQREAVQIVATVGFAGKDGSRAGRAVLFNSTPAGKLSCTSASTDSAGIARTTCTAIEVAHERNFDALQDEVRRQMGMKTSGRIKRIPSKEDKIESLKEKEASAMEALDGEAEKLPDPGMEGTDTPGLYKPMPPSKEIEFEIKGDRVTFGATIGEYQDQVKLDILERPCPANMNSIRISGGSGPNNYKCASKGSSTGTYATENPEIPANGPGRTPANGEPGTTASFPDGNGGKTDRVYGPDGRAIKDIDHGHDHGIGDPHAHDWDWDNDEPRGPGRPLLPGENK